MSLAADSEERAFLQAAGIPVEVVPGISSACGGRGGGRAVDAPRAEQRLRRGDGAPGRRRAHCARLGALARIDTVVVLMGLAAAGEIAQRLIDSGPRPGHPRG